MEQTQQKTWTMKHPALAKAFAVLFAVMSVILLAAGISGIGKAQEDNAERLRYEKKFAERIANYEELCTRLENSITYDEAWAELEKRIEEHEEDASQHRTDLALHTAEKGGYTMGADMLWEAMPQIKGAKQELEAGKAQLAAGEAQLAAGKQAYAAMSGAISQAKTDAAAGAASCGEVANSDVLNGFLQQIKEQLAKEPKNPFVYGEAVGDIEYPTLDVQNPDETGTPPNPGDEVPSGDGVTQEQIDKYNTELQLYKEAVNAYNDAKTQYDADVITYDEAYNNALADWKTNTYDQWVADNNALLYGILTSQDFANEQQKLAGIGTQLGAVYSSVDSIVSAFGVNLSDKFPMPGGGGGEAVAPSTLGELSAAISGMMGQATALQSVFYGLAAVPDTIGATFAESEQLLAATRTQLAVAEQELKKAEAEAQGALENIWYELGQLEEERAKLAEDKLALDEEASVLSKEILEADELHELENDRTSAKLLLTSVKEVDDMVEAGGEIVPSAEKYLADYKAQTELQNKGWLASCVLAILGGVAGLLAIPAAYELIHKRVWLIAPAVVSVVLAAASEASYYAVGLGWWYVGMFAAIIGLIHLLIVLPKEKIPGGA